MTRRTLPDRSRPSPPGEKRRGSLVAVWAVAILAVSCSTSDPSAEGADPDDLAPSSLDLPAATTTVERVVTYTDNGIQMSFPGDWHQAEVSYTPNLSDPQELVTISSGPLPAADDYVGCAQFPMAAVKALGHSDVLVSIQERADGGLLDPKPDRFPTVEEGNDVSEDCLDSPKEFLHWFEGFSVGGRDFYAYVAMGPEVSPERERETWAVLDGFDVTAGPAD